MTTNTGIAPHPAEYTLVIFACDLLFSERELNHPFTIWISLWDFYQAMKKGKKGLEGLFDTSDIRQALLFFTATPEKILEYKKYLLTAGIKNIYRTHQKDDIFWRINNLPRHRNKETATMRQGDTRFPFTVLHGKQHTMEYLVAGFPESQLPEEVRQFPRMQFVPPDEVYALGKISSGVQVGILNSEMETDDLNFVRGQLTRLNLPRNNILLIRDLSPWGSWFYREFAIPQANNHNDHQAKPPKLQLVVGRNEDYLPPQINRSGHFLFYSGALDGELPENVGGIFLSKNLSLCERGTVEEQAANLGVPLVYFDEPKEILTSSSSDMPETKPQVLVLGVNLSAIPDVASNRLFSCFSYRDAANLTSIPASTKLVVMTDRDFKPDTILRLKELSKKANVKVYHLGGGTGAFKKWLERTNISRELLEIERESSATQIEPSHVTQANEEANLPVAATLPEPPAEECIAAPPTVEQALNIANQTIARLQISNLRLDMENKALKAKLQKLQS